MHSAATTFRSARSSVFSNCQVYCRALRQGAQYHPCLKVAMVSDPWVWHLQVVHRVGVFDADESDTSDDDMEGQALGLKGIRSVSGSTCTRRPLSFASPHAPQNITADSTRGRLCKPCTGPAVLSGLSWSALAPHAWLECCSCHGFGTACCCWLTGAELFSALGVRQGRWQPDHPPTHLPACLPTRLSAIDTPHLDL